MNTISLVTASLIILAGVIDDLRSRKVHNWLFLVGTAVAFGASVFVGGLSGLHQSFLGFSAGFITLLPLVLLKVVGAGDMKLLAAAGAAVGWTAVVNIAILSLIWGAIFGLIQIAINGQLRQTVVNMVQIAQMKDRTQLTLHKIPFTVALAMGWITDLVYQGVFL
jgi:prepilin peptidase CpaA